MKRWVVLFLSLSFLAVQTSSVLASTRLTKRADASSCGGAGPRACCCGCWVLEEGAPPPSSPPTSTSPDARAQLSEKIQRLTQAVRQMVESGRDPA